MFRGEDETREIYLEIAKLKEKVAWLENSNLLITHKLAEHLGLEPHNETLEQQLSDMRHNDVEELAAFMEEKVWKSKEN